MLVFMSGFSAEVVKCSIKGFIENKSVDGKVRSRSIIIDIWLTAHA